MMPSLDFDEYGLGDRERIGAWHRHYLAKGCSSWKASQCAARKRRTNTWPPK